jgi:hypothetical protein
MLERSLPLTYMIPLDEESDLDEIPIDLLDPVVDKTEYERRALDSQHKHTMPMLAPRRDMVPTPMPIPGNPDTAMRQMVADLVEGVSRRTAGQRTTPSHTGTPPSRRSNRQSTPSAQALRNITDVDTAPDSSSISMPAPAAPMLAFSVNPGVERKVNTSQYPPNE